MKRRRYGLTKKKKERKEYGKNVILCLLLYYYWRFVDEYVQRTGLQLLVGALVLLFVIIIAIFVYVIINIISLHGDRRRGYGENPALDQVAAPANAAFIQLSYITFGEGFGNFYIVNTESFFTLVETLSRNGRAVER